VGNPRPLRPRCRWVDNIKTDLREIGGVVQTGLMWLKMGTSEMVLVNTVMNLWVPQNIKFLSSCTPSDFSSKPQLQEVSYLVI
jgi:hypothetical protein